MSASDTLKLYLNLRSEGDWDFCRGLLSKNFLERFNQEYGTDYLDYYRNQSKDLYSSPKIIDIKELHSGKVIANVLGRVERAGYTADVLERYIMFKERGDWWIAGWEPVIGAAEAKATLELYLDLRSKGDYDTCRRFLSKNYLKKFNRKYGTDYLDFMRTDETDYKNPIIIGLRELDCGKVVADVSVIAEGPGERSTATERYRMIREQGDWKVDDWQIEWGEELPLPVGPLPSENGI